MEVRWNPAGELNSLLADRAESATARQPVDVLGHPGELFHYDGGGDFTALWVDGPHVVEARGAFDTVELYRAQLERLELVDVETWLSAMPESVITPATRAAVVDGMLRDIPRPEGFDTEALYAGGGVDDRYQLGAEVAGSVACAWIEQWIEAGDTGDGASAEAAAVALATSPDWPVLQAMDAEGDYPEAVWELSSEASRPGAGTGPSPALRSRYVASLGCSQG